MSQQQATESTLTLGDKTYPISSLSDEACKTK